MKKLNVLHVHVSLYQPYLMVKALRELGHKADYLVFENESIRWLIHDADFFLGNKKSLGDIAAVIKFFAYAIRKYDVFHFHSLPGFIPPGWSDLLDKFVGLDLGLLKRMGKTIVFSHWGCHDGYRPSSFAKFENGRVCSECNQYNGMCTDKYVETKCKPQMKYADFIINHDPDFEGYNRGSSYLHGLIDTDFWNPEESVPDRFVLEQKSNDTVKIYHGFANSNQRGGFEKNIKGSKYIKDAVERLQNEGHNVKFMYFNKTSNKELKYYQLQADIIVDQLFYGWIGSTAREGMALGKPVVTFIRKEWLANQDDLLPVVSADSDSIYHVLKNLVVNEGFRKKMGIDARTFAVEKLDYRATGKRLSEIYSACRNN